MAITGASGVIYGKRLVEELIGRGNKVILIISEAGRKVIQHELAFSISDDIGKAKKEVEKFFNIKKGKGLLSYYDPMDLFSPIVSGSFETEGMIICPASMGTIGRIASGLSHCLIERAADVVIKEKRRLIIVPREMPLNQIHLNNMLTLSKAGAEIVPAMPAFYHHPQNMEDLVYFVVGKILERFDINHNLYKKWR